MIRMTKTERKSVQFMFPHSPSQNYSWGLGKTLRSYSVLSFDKLYMCTCIYYVSYTSIGFCMLQTKSLLSRSLLVAGVFFLCKFFYVKFYHFSSFRNMLKEHDLCSKVCFQPPDHGAYTPESSQLISVSQRLCIFY